MVSRFRCWKDWEGFRCEVAAKALLVKNSENCRRTRVDMPMINDMLAMNKAEEP